jgi:Tfp pilus assembly protein PilN
MQDIDFLPADFKRRRTNRHGRSWRVAIGAAAIGLLMVVAVGQSHARRQIEERLALTEPERQLMDAQQSQLTELRRQLAETEAQAELLAYVGHPWPRTQLLAAALRSLPDSIVFQRISIAGASVAGQSVRRQRGDETEDDLATLEPALRDLRLLRAECDSAEVSVTLEGTTTDGIALHRYLDRLNDVPLLDKVELQSLESTGDDTVTRFRFEARLTVRPGYGQPNGPRGPSEQLAGASRLSTVESNQP